MKKIYIFTAVLALLTLSLNAQFQAKKNVAQTQQTTPNGKKVDMSLGVAKMASTPAINRAPNRATTTTDVTFTGFSSSSVERSKTIDGVTLTTSTGDLGYTAAMRLNGTVTISTDNGTITKIVFNGYNTSYPVTSLSTSTGNYNTSNNVGTWTGDAASISFTASNYVYCSSIVVTVETETGGEGTSDLTVCDGQYFSQYLPLLGYYHDEAQHNQMIYPASMLASMVGKTIKSMTFYPTSGSVTWNDGTTESASGINFYNGSVCFKLANISSGSSFDADNPSFVTATLTEVKTVSMPISANTSATTWVISFDQDFVYTGGDLLIDVTNPTTGQWGLTFFTVDDTGDNYYGYINTGAGNGALNYLPKVTFTYEGEPNPVHDLAIALSAPATAGAGNTIDVTATVTNNGDFAENGYTVTFSDGTTTFSTQTGGTLAAGATQTFTATYTTTNAQGGTTVNFSASVACTDDADATNNSATASTQVTILPPPENVAATPGNNMSATVTWDLPIIATVPATLTWDFEEQSDFNDFTTIDADGDGYNWAWHQNTGSSDLTTNSGDGIVYSESYHKLTSGGTVLHPDNWLISPEVTLGGTLEFYACGQDPNQYWNEVFGVYVCVGSYNGVTDFVQVGADVTTTHDMTKYTYNLSQYQGQGYFAIVHHNVSDEFYLNVDDITYTYGVGNYPISYNVYLDGQLVKNVSSSTFSYDFSNLADGEHTCAVSAVYSYGESVAVPATFTITSLPTPNAPTVNSTNGTTSTTITITPDPVTDGNLVYYVEYNGQQTQDLTFPRGATEYVVYVHAHTTATANYNESPEAVVPVTIPALPQTEAPVISYETVGDNVVITATGNGTVTLNIPGYPEATGTGSASITVPRHMEDYTVTATATAQEADHLASETTTEQVPISGLVNDGDWLQMDGSYTTGSQQLTFTRGNNPILFVDQFTAETQNNEHPDHYDYYLSEDVENDAKTSSTIPIPVHKTYSTLQGLYTKAEVDNDALNTPRELTANAVNGTMAYDIKAGSEVYFYGLYRGALDANPVIDDSHRISMIQKDLNEAFFNENMTNDVEPKYSHIDAGDIKRVDKGYVTGNNSNTMAYVPVIWTYGDHTGRPAATGNNSYGSDIKRMKIGDVTARIEGTKSDGNSWGKWKVGETEYCVYTPVISITGIMPVDIPQGDGDYATYEPYMFRAWCTYDKAYDFGHDADGHLVGGDLIPAPFLLDSVLLEPNQKEYVLGGDWNGETRMPWAFGVEVGESATNITFLIRFYYKKVVTDAQQSSKLMGNRDGEGAEEYFAVECEGDAQGIVTAINEILNGRIPIETTYVNAQGMTSNKPFDGLNIVVTRYSDGSTTTTKVVR